MTPQEILTRVRTCFEGTLAQHGPCARGVAWPSAEAQTLRFRELCRVIDDPSASVTDYGCGYGALAAYLREHGYTGRYCGFDISTDMLAAARATQTGCTDCVFTSDRRELQPADYTLACGIFNMKQGVADDEWREYMIRTIHDMASLGRRGIAFNVLTTYVEWRDAALYYADPLELFDYCKRNVSRRVSLLHDAPTWDFTLLARF